MRTSHIVAALVALLVLGSLPGLARAEIGLGGEVSTTGLTTASLVFDTGSLHVHGLLGARSIEDDTTRLVFGGRIFFVVHRGHSSDFALGAGASIAHQDNDQVRDSTDLHLEGAANFRAFLTPNVALSASIGLGIVFDDEDPDDLGVDRDRILFGGQIGGTLGLHYYF